MSPNSTSRRAGRPRKTGDDTLPTREKILATAADLFSRHGFTGVSVRDITRTVGVKESSLYNHFTNKEALLDAIFDAMEREFASRALTEQSLWNGIEQSTPEEFMRASFQRFMAFWQDPLRIRLWFVISMEQYRNPRAGQLVLNETQRVIDLVAIAFDQMQRSRKIVSLDTRMLAETFAGTLRGMQMEFAILMSAGEKTTTVERRMDDFITFFASFIAARPGEDQTWRLKWPKKFW
jgi:AcrR family transcriptional regulator